MTVTCGVPRPDGSLAGDVNWNSVMDASDWILLYNFIAGTGDPPCTAKPPSIFDPLGGLQFNASGVVFSRCTGNISVWNVGTGSEVNLSSNTTTQVGSSGIYYWNTSGLQTQPTVLTDYVYQIGHYYGKFTLKSTRGGTRYGSSTWLLGLFHTGDTVTISVWEDDGTSVGLSSNSCVELGSTGIFKWNTSNISSQPGSETFYVYKLDNELTDDTYTGAFYLQSGELGGSETGIQRNPSMGGGMI